MQLGFLLDKYETYVFFKKQYETLHEKLDWHDVNSPTYNEIKKEIKVIVKKIKEIREEELNE